jgi:hypothetical protein
MRHPQIKHESDIYNTLAGGRKKDIYFVTTKRLISFTFPFLAGIPQCHWHGEHDKFDCIVIDLLGPNLSQLKKSTKRFSVETIVDLGCKMVNPSYPFDNAFVY